MAKTSFTAIALFLCFSVSAQTGSVSGKILSTDGKPLDNISVVLLNTRSGTVSNNAGYYIIRNIKPGEYKIQVSATDSLKETRSIVITANKTTEENFVVKYSATTLDAITVTGVQPVTTSRSEYVSKMPLKNLENAQVYTGLTNTLIVQQRVFSIADLVSNAPGINKQTDAFSTSIAYGGANYSSRGFLTGVAVLNGLSNNIAMPEDLQNTERMEVIKGPSATLFGSLVTSYGGLMNRVTKKPYENFGGSATLTGGSYGFMRLGTDLNMPLNKEKTFLSRLNFSISKKGNFQDNGASTQRILVAPSFTYRFSDRVELDLNAEMYSQTSHGTGRGVFFNITPSLVTGYLDTVLGGIGIPPATIAAIKAAAPKTLKESFGEGVKITDFGFDPYRSYSSSDFESKMSSLNFNSAIRYRITDQISSTTSALFSSGTDDGYDIWLQLIPNMVPALIASLPTGNISFGSPGADYITRDARRFNSYLETHQVQQNFNGDFNIGPMRNRMVLGLDYYHYKLNSTYKNFTGSMFGIPFEGVYDIVKIKGPNPDYYDFNRLNVDEKLQNAANEPLFISSDQNVYSAYVNDVLNITRTLLVSAGVRVDRFETKGDYDGRTDSYGEDFHQTAFSPKFGIVYQPLADKVALFGNYQTGFTNVNGRDREGSAFKPEKSFQVEGGVKFSFFNNAFTGTLSYYDIKVEDKVRPDNINIFFSVQDGTQVSRGFEAEILGNPIPSLNILLGYAYNHSKMIKASPDIEGLRPNTAGPANQFNFWLHYHFSAKNFLNGFSVGAGGNYVDETLVVNLNPDGSFKNPSYTLLKAKLSFDKPKYSIAIRVDNLLNHQYWIGTGVIAPQFPREIAGTVAIKF
jgi:iron complex outermembrane receptor protein